ncbi:MAG TPA: ABC transporter ATP-binding protein [Sulfurovum sp.]|nr:ABC transporter ATP-binding protein [Sulfurovum sp.]
MTNLQLLSLITVNFKEIIQEDKKNILYLLYYSTIESVLLLVTPLTSAFIINSVLAHATVSIYAMAFIIMIIFFMITALQVLKSYMIEKFEQKIFVNKAIEISRLAAENKNHRDKENLDKYMNYFFDVISIQKLFPNLLLAGSSLLVKLIISLVLLLIFDVSLFALGVFFIIIFSIIMIILGREGPRLATERSNAKHEAIYFIQDIPSSNGDPEDIYTKLDALLTDFVNKRNNIFSVIIKQLSLSYVSEGFILSSFFILGGYLVFQGAMPIGEFVAAEIIIISITYTMKDFIKQIDYIYDSFEGFYKIDKLNHTLRKEKDSDA